jgi:hypothetical protein
MMSVEQLRQMMERDKLGELAATSYFQGAVEALLIMEGLREKGALKPREFCKVTEAHATGRPMAHPAFRAREAIKGWQSEGRPMNTNAADMVFAFMAGRNYGCGPSR